MEYLSYTTEQGNQYKIVDLILEKHIVFNPQFGYVTFIITDLKKIGLQKGNNRYLLRIENVDTWGNKTKTKFTSINKVINYIEKHGGMLITTQTSKY